MFKIILIVFSLHLFSQFLGQTVRVKVIDNSDSIFSEREYLKNLKSEL